jgi:hypothetical protein
MADVLIAPTYDAMDSDYSIRIINDINYNLIHFSDDDGFLINKYTSDVSLIFETGNSIVAQDSGGGSGGGSDSAGSEGGSSSPTNVQRWIA